MNGPGIARRSRSLPKPHHFLRGEPFWVHRRAWRAGVTVAILLLLMPFGGPGGDAAHPTWETPHTGDGPALFALDLQDRWAVAVGRSGQMLTETDNGWAALPAPTDRDLFGLAFAGPRGLAVGMDGVILELGPHWGEPGTPSAGVDSAHGRSGSGSTERRIVEWRLPLDLLGIGADARFGLGVTAHGAADDQNHPPDLDPERPSTTDAVRFNDVMRGTPTIDGQLDPAWPPAVRADYVTGPVPFSVHLLRDADALYVLVGGRNTLEGASLQIHQTHTSEPQIGDHRFRHMFDGAPPTQATTGVPTWEVHRGPGELTHADLHDVAWLDATTPLAVGSGGAAYVRHDRAWTQLATGTTRDLNAVSVRDGTALIAGAAGTLTSKVSPASGTSGAVLLKSDGWTVDAVTVPPGSYGLHAIDGDACGAGGSGGTILLCVGGDLTDWTRHSLPNDLQVRDIDRDGTTGRTWAVGTYGDGSPALFQRTTDGWVERHLSMPAAGLTALRADADRLVVATLDGSLHTLSKHAPVFLQFPENPTATEGKQLLLDVIGDDLDGDGLQIDIEPREGIPFPKDLEVRQEAPDHWVFDWTPPHPTPPRVGLDVTLSDGDKTVRRGMDIDVITGNAPPYWNPHPDATIAHSLPWTTYVQAHDPDNDPLTLGAVVPSGATFTDLGGGQGRIDWTPTLAQVGDHQVDLVASDGALTATMSFNVRVVDNKAPVFDQVPLDQTLCVAGPWWSGTVSLSARAHDPEGTPVTYSWTFHTDGTTTNGSSVQRTYNTTGAHLVSVTATDGHGVQTTRFFTIYVDACVHVEVEIDRSCIFLTHKNSGTIRMWDHNGDPTNGTYQIRIRWDPWVGAKDTTVLGGVIVNGSATFTIPQDHDALPLNHLNAHQVTATGYKPSLFAGYLWDTDRADYLVHPLCGFLSPLP